jgi:Xaa-Pro aminopeptidase
VARPRLGRVLGGRRIGIEADEYTRRRERLGELLARRGLGALFVPPGSDLEYLTGIERDLPTFGNISYAHGWVTGVFLAPGREPVYVLPRMFVRFHLDGEAPDGTYVVEDDGDGRAAFAAAVREIGSPTRIAIGQRAWAETAVELLAAVPGAELSEGTSLVNELRRVKSNRELELIAEACLIARHAMAAVELSVVPGTTMLDLVEQVEHELSARGSRCPSFPTHIFTWGERRLDSGGPGSREALREGEVVLFDFGAVHQGYCSDFGRTIACGEPPAEYAEVTRTLLEAQEAGRAAARPGGLAREVNAACRAPIEAAGLGEGFRHRMGHGIGLDVHERPFLSVEDRTPLEAGMTFTDEPSILLDGRFGVRVEDVLVVTESGGRML